MLLIFDNDKMNSFYRQSQSYHEKLNRAIRDIPFKESSVVLCMACGTGEKEETLFRNHYDKIHLMICSDISQEKIDIFKKRTSDPKLLIESFNMDLLTSEAIQRLNIDTICLMGFSSNPNHLLNVLLYNPTYFNFLENGGRIILEPAISGKTSSNPDDHCFIRVPMSTEMYYFSSMLSGVFSINIYNNIFLEIKECILEPYIIDNLRKFQDNKCNPKVNLSEI